MKKICLAYNPYKNENLELASALESILKDFVEIFKIVVDLNKDFIEVIPEDLDLIVVLGGDGTLLTCVRKFIKYKIPFLGINTGHLGFLTEAKTPNDFKNFFITIFNGNYKKDLRTTLCTKIIKANKMIIKEEIIALNEITIIRSSRSNILQLDLEINQDYVANYFADGLIISTPTGSTAYSLSAGGAVLAPNIQAFQISPICAHSLTSRSLVVSDMCTLKVNINEKNHKDSKVSLQADGQDIFDLETGDSVIIEKSPYIATLIHSLDQENGFYKVLNKKLSWGIRS